ncbi:MAG TPA: glutathione S-transferase family protein [Vineibacter sp.]|nr:glutathione S-transferase family protein [Vineibacter sp.]
MADEIVFYTNPMSRGRVVRWMLEELGMPYRTEVLEYGTTMKAPSYLAINPMGKVPSIRHGETVVTEAAAICTYLADAFPQARLAPPPESRLRGPYYRWLFFAAGPVEQAISVKACGWVTPSERRGMVGFGTLEDVLNTIEAVLDGRDCLVGDSFTAADLYLGAHLAWGMQIGAFETRPAFETYAGRLYSRSAAIRAKEIDDSIIAGRQAANPEPAN